MSFLGAFPHTPSGIHGSTLTPVIPCGQEVSNTFKCSTDTSQSGKVHICYTDSADSFGRHVQLLYSRGSQIFQKKSKNYLKILGARRMSTRRTI
jgi:hypothetical protein